MYDRDYKQCCNEYKTHNGVEYNCANTKYSHQGGIYAPDHYNCTLDFWDGADIRMSERQK
jgi:hypothetical protein